MANLLSTTVNGALSASGRISVTYNTDRYQFNFNRTSASNWWVTNDSTALGLHVDNVGDKFYFSTAGDFWSSTNGWLSTALAAKQNASTAITTSNIGSQSVSYASTAGYSDEAKWISYPDGPRDLSDRLPNWNNRSVAWDFVGAGTANGSGNYGGVMTFVPWDGTSASTGDSSYQLAFANTTGVNASGQPKLSIRNGINSTWNAWYTLIHSGNIGSYALTSYSETDTLSSVTGRGATTASQVSFTKTDDHAISVGTIRGRAVGSQTGEFIQLYERVNIGGPNGWGAANTSAPTYGLSVYGGATIGYGNSGGLAVTGTLSATNFSGSSSGTNTGDQTNISGNSATTSQIVFSDLKINFPSGAGGGHSFGANHYSMGLDSGNGGWDSPHYRDVIIGYHTGIRIGANYSGVRFYDNSPTTDANNDGNGDGAEKLLMTIGGYVGTANHTDVVVNNNLFANVSMRAPIFYDSQDTSYYGDFAGTSNLNFLNLGNTREEFPLLKMGAAGRYALGVSGAYTRLSSHNQGSGVQLGYYDGTTFTPRLTVSNDGNVVAESSLRAPIFYDSADTGYYLDPNSTSYLYHLVLSGNSYFRPNTWIQFDGNYGVYWPNHYGLHIYPNNDGSYGSLQVKGSKNSWHGIHFDSGSTLMMNSGETGVHRQGVGWQWRWYDGEMYISAGSTGGGTERKVIHSGNIGSQSVNSSTSAAYLNYTGVGATQINANTFGYGRASNYYGTGQILNSPEGAYASLYNFGGTNESGLSLQMFASVNHNDTASTRNLWFRVGNNLGFQNDWKQVIHSGNIGSQSVSYADESGFASSAGSVEWTSVQNKPATFPPSSHNHDDRYYTESESDGKYLIGTTNPGSVANFTISIGNNGSYSYVQSHSGQPLYLNPVGNSIVLNSTTTIAGTTQFNGNVSWFSGTSNIGLENQTTFARFAFNKLTFWDWNNGYDVMTIDDGYVSSATSFRAPIFYDSQDIAYYLDPNNTGTSLNIAGGIVTTAPGGSVLLKHAVSEADAWIFQENAANWGLYWKNNPSGNHTFGGYTTVGAELFGMSAANTSGNGVLTTNFVGATAAYAQYMLSNFTGYIWSASTIFAAGDMRAPIFYDSQNTGYYGDFASTSVMNAIRLGTSTNNGTISGGGEWGMRLTTDSGYIQFGPANSSWAHIYSGMPFYFNQELYVNGTQVVKNSGTWSINISGNAASASSVAWGNVSSKPSRWLNATNLIDDNAPDTTTESGFWQSYLGSGNPTGTWFNYVNVRHSNPANAHGYQIGMSYYDNNLWFRSYQGSGTYQTWSRALGTNTDPYPSNMNQYVRTTDDVTHNSTTSPLFLVNGHSDNTKGYRIHNTSGSSVSAMFTNSSNQLVIAAGAVDQINLNKKVYVNGVALGVNIAPSATAGRIDASNDIVAYSSSDERLKENITPIANALDKVKSLTGVEFDWKPEHKEAHGHEGHDTGIIAQQVLGVMPTAVRTNDTGYLAVRYEKLIGLLIEGMKEQQSQIEELKAKLDGLTK